eukprot:CAMPEP_0168695202 /NCGR_PEP_ID=MMETSP0503-20121227/34697_1 /TAXON_ID=89963 /ORGANISM="Heterocapsa rotundata, Strain SCCAP K-0483" /LENGTH=70 /DNA_ID=CAMNT_0008740889 /DNA_START=35 /DNA_END=244 /DNA_ORIENTATION=+
MAALPVTGDGADYRGRADPGPHGPCRDSPTWRRMSSRRDSPGWRPAMVVPSAAASERPSFSDAARAVWTR